MQNNCHICIDICIYTCIYLKYTYCTFNAVLWELGLNLTILQLFWLLYGIFVLVSLKLCNKYQNFNVLLLCILSYYTYSGTEYSNTHFVYFLNCNRFFLLVIPYAATIGVLCAPQDQL